MTQPAEALIDGAAPAPAPAVSIGTIATRFGDFAIDPEKVITFEQGLYGLEHHRRFLLTEVPSWPGFFKLLQAIDDPRLSLIVLPLESRDGPIDPRDFDHACGTIGYDPAATAVIGIVTMRDDGDCQMFTVNLKAPLLIDSHRRSGRQHVFANDRYPLRHPLQAHDQTGD